MKALILSVVCSLITFGSLCGATAVPTSRVTQWTATGGHTHFLAIGRPAMMKISAEGGGPQGRLTYDGKWSGELNVDLNSFQTGIDLRDHHMKEKYLMTSQYPQATLVLQNITAGLSTAPSWPDLEAPPQKEIKFAGLLNLHGVQKPVEGVFQVQKAANGDPSSRKIIATFDLKISDYAIDIPSYAGIKVADTVTVTVESDLRLDKAAL